jgi:hypothetical protein
MLLFVTSDLHYLDSVIQVSTMKAEVACFSPSFVSTCKSVMSNNAEDSNLHNHRRGNIGTCTDIIVFSAMKTVVLWLFLLSALCCSSGSGELKCALPPSAMKFALTSYRNKTGHWKAQVSKRNHIPLSFRSLGLRRIIMGSKLESETKIQ